VLDLSGNVWEWTRSLWGQWDEKRITVELQFPYPYDPADGREELDAGDEVCRVVRGGSFDDYQGYARCASPFRGYPSLRDRSGGFRVVVSHLSALHSDTLHSGTLGQ